VLGRSSKRSQAVGTVRVGAKGRVQPSQGLAAVNSLFAAPVLQGSEIASAGPRAMTRFLKVGEVAERLGVSTATVYALCKRGELAHLRFANSIRVSERVLEALCSRK